MTAWRNWLLESQLVLAMVYNWGGAPLFLTAFHLSQLWRESGTHLLLGEYKEKSCTVFLSQDLQSSKHSLCVGIFNRCIRVLATRIFEKMSVASTRTLGRGEVILLAPEWTLIGSELSSPNFNSSVRVEWSPTFGCWILFACFQSQIATESQRCFCGSRSSDALLRNLADFDRDRNSTEIHFGREKPEHANAPNNCSASNKWQCKAGS